MRRPIQAILALAIAALVFSACAGTPPSAPPLADAQAVINAAIASSQAAKTVHAQIAVDGKAAVALPIGGATGSVDLTGTTASADIDKANSAAHATFAVPGFLEPVGRAHRGRWQGVPEDDDHRAASTASSARARSLPVDPANTNGMLEVARRVPAEARRRSRQGRGRGLRLASSATRSSVDLSRPSSPPSAAPGRGACRSISRARAST